MNDQLRVRLVVLGFRADVGSCRKEPLAADWANGQTWSRAAGKQNVRSWKAKIGG